MRQMRATVGAYLLLGTNEAILPFAIIEIIGQSPERKNRRE
jgi:hypothetical protein